MNFPPLVGSQLHIRQTKVAAQFREERSRQLQRAASASILGHRHPQQYSDQDASNSKSAVVHSAASTRSPSACSQYSNTSATRQQGKSEPRQQPEPRGSPVPRPGGQSTRPAQNPQLDLLLEGIRNRFMQLGITSMSEINRMFAEMDTQHQDGLLNKEEFVRGLEKLGMPFNQAAFIFDAFNSDGRGFIDAEEFCYLVKGGLNDRRRRVVHQAFHSLDRSGDGVIAMDDLEKAFDVAKVVEKMHGAKTKQEMMAEFLSTFDTMHKDGKVSLLEFEMYYENVGALCPSDDYFEAMVRNAWHLEGADGGACLRLRITDFDGNSRVVEIREGIDMINRQSPRFFEKARKMLEDRGYKDIANIEMFGRY